MPLSEEELRMLEQMERALLAEDPKFASTLRGSRMRGSARRRVIASAVAFLVGVVLLMVGVVVPIEIVGVVGFVVMLGSAVVGLTASRAQPSDAAPDSPEHLDSGLTLIDGGRRPRRPGRSRSSESFVDRMEQRWRRRRDERGGF